MCRYKFSRKYNKCVGSIKCVGRNFFRKSTEIVDGIINPGILGV